MDTPAVRSAAEAIASVFDLRGDGGNLRVLIDDWDLDDATLAFCAALVAGGGLGRFDPPVVLAAERAAIDGLRPLTEAERTSALALYHEYWGPARPRLGPNGEGN